MDSQRLARYAALLLAFALATMEVRSDDEDEKKLKEVLALISRYYVDDIDIPPAMQSSMDAILENLDPYSAYIPTRQQSNQGTSTGREGIGIEFVVTQDTPRIVGVMGGGPSEGVGLRPCDAVLMINDSSAIGIRTEDVLNRLRGPEGSLVNLLVQRPAMTNPVKFAITRGRIPRTTVVSYMLSSDIGYLRLTRFGTRTTREALSALDTLQSLGMNRFILDLRNNVGGYLEQAYGIVNELLPGKKRILRVEGRRPELNEDNWSNGDARFSELPLVVLIDAGSAAASEIVAGAVQDWDRGLVVGEPSWGNGVIQRQFDLADGSALRLTTGRWYSPSGRSVHRPRVRGRVGLCECPSMTINHEGENILHTAEHNPAKAKFFTSSGRTVTDGDGVVPDYFVREPQAELLIKLRAKDVLRSYANTYITSNGDTLRKRFGEDFQKFQNEFQVTDEMLIELRLHADIEGTNVDSIQYEPYRLDVQTLVKGEIAKALWGSKAWYWIMNTVDHQLQRAMTLFGEAEKMSGIH